jgi:predicted site-specific integrase-resolvase
MNELIRLKTVALRLGEGPSTKTLRRWIDAGIIHACQGPNGGPLTMSPAQIDHLLEVLNRRSKHDD